MLFKKFTTGVVVQSFNDAGECVEQEFKIYDHGSVEYETAEGYPIDVDDLPLNGREYFPFDMVQPNMEQSHEKHTLPQDLCHDH
jgi:hypothetical protein